MNARTRRDWLGRTAAVGLGGWTAWPARATVRARIGLVLPFSGPQAEVAQELRSGYDFAFRRAALSGIHVEALWEDDRGSAEATANVVASFARDRSVLATSGIVGTPHALLALPEAARGGLPVVGIRSGATALRNGAPGVFHLRASFEEEIALMLKYLKGAGLGRFSVVYPQDAFGTEAMQHLQAAARQQELVIATAQPCERNGADLQGAVEQAVDISQRAGALIMLTLPEVTLKGVVHARKNCAFVAPVFCMSFCATRSLAQSKAPALEGLALASPFPLPWSSEATLASSFRQMIKETRQEHLLYSMAAFEGFVYGSALTSTLAQLPDAGRASLQLALRRPLDLGGLRIQFDARNVGYRYLQMIHKNRNGGLSA